MRQFIGIGKNTGFTCTHCAQTVPPLDNGSYRNHCPYCLYSVHVDINPGDRASDCGGILEPTGVDYSAKKGWSIIHSCLSCGDTRRNKAALEDSTPDNYDLIIELSQNVNV